MTQQVDLMARPIAADDTLKPRRAALLLLVSSIGLVCAGTAIGLLLKSPLDGTAIGQGDRAIAEWFAEHRTPDLNSYTVWGSGLADTFIKIGATAVLAVALYLWWHRLLEPLMLVVSLVLEAATFISVTWLVRRPRPDVERLEGSPVGSSFPSGHTAAAAAYGALVVIVMWHTRNQWARGATVALCAAVAAIVGLSRMYRGMHYLTDVIAGVVLGVVCVAITAAILERTTQGLALTQAADRKVQGAS